MWNAQEKQITKRAKRTYFKNYLKVSRNEQTMDVRVDVHVLPTTLIFAILSYAFYKIDIGVRTSEEKLVKKWNKLKTLNATKESIKVYRTWNKHWIEHLTTLGETKRQRNMQVK